MASISEVTDRVIFDSKLQVLVNPVNCMGVMGKGLALEFKLRYPSMFEQYEQVCRTGGLRPGKLLLYRDSAPWILNFPTKDHWRDPAVLSYLELGLKKFAATYQERDIHSIAFPRLGTTLGQLDWSTVRPLMYRYLSPLQLSVEIYQFSPSSTDSLFHRFLNRVRPLDCVGYMDVFGLKRKAAELLESAVSSGTVTNMQAIQSIDGFGEKSVAAVYHALRTDGGKSGSDEQLSLF